MNRNRVVLTAVFTAGALIGALIVWALSRPVQTVTLDGQRAALAVAGDCIEAEVIHNGVPERLRSAGCDGVPVPSSTPTPAAATPTRGRGTSTPTNTPGVTMTPTPTGGATVTATPTVEPPGGHDLMAWHEPAFFHHHGADPLGPAVHPQIVEWLTTDEWGPLFAAVGHPWGTTPIENVTKHQGHVNLTELDTGCDLGRQEPEPGDLCIKAYLYSPHAWPVADEVLSRKHSWKAVVLVCRFDDELEQECGIIAAGGHHDFGERTAAYKRATCDFPDNPAYEEGHVHNQPPYLAGVGSGMIPDEGRGVFWNSSTRPVIAYAFDIVPNQFLDSGFIDQPWSIMSLDPAECQQREFDYAPCWETGDCRNNGTRFQVFFMTIHNLDELSRPFRGYLDMYGRVDESCQSPGPNCAPLYVGADVPVGSRALFNRVVDPFNCEEAPCQVYGEGADLRPPGTYPLAAPAAEPTVEPYP